jgi:hypothetical protein
VSGPEEELAALAEEIPVVLIGTVGGEALIVDGDAGRLLDLALAELRQAYRSLQALFP